MQLFFLMEQCPMMDWKIMQLVRDVEAILCWIDGETHANESTPTHKSEGGLAEADVEMPHQVHR
jgi:hypothetical protein